MLRGQIQPAIATVSPTHHRLGMKMSYCEVLLLLNSAKEQFLFIHQGGDKYKQILWFCMFTFHFKMM